MTKSPASPKNSAAFFRVLCKEKQEGEFTKNSWLCYHQRMSYTYPISLLLAGKAVLVVGGGEVAARKVKGLCECGACITVVAPALVSELKQLADSGLCHWANKTYETPDLAEATLVFACTDDEVVNARIWEDATQKNILVNVADRPDFCSFYLPSVLRRGKLSVAVSTDGSSPMTARLIRENLEEQFDDTIAEYLSLLQSWREKIASALPASKRRLFWQRVSEKEVYKLVKFGELAQAEAVLTDLYNELQQESQ